MKKDIHTFKMTISLPMVIKTGVPSYIMLDFLVKSFPYMLKQSLQDPDIDIEIKEVFEKN